MTALASVDRFDTELTNRAATTEEVSGLHRIDAAAPAASPSLLAGKYRLDALLGEGGMGEVWRALNVQLEVPVAVKLLPPDLQSPELGDRLRIEARAIGRLVHPAIVRVFDAGESEQGEPFLVMELLRGESLGDAMDRGPLSARSIVQLLLPIVEALALAHSRGVVHRDLKPDNIFIAMEGGTTQPKLLDFGLAKLTSDAQSATKLTRAGTLLGSPDYMSPEQARGELDIDHRSDLWSLCVVLYEALAGRAPFAASNCHALLRSIIEDAPPSLEAIAGIDPKLSALVQRGLEKDRERRYQSSVELGHALARWLIEQGVEQDVTGASLAKWQARPSASAMAIARQPVEPVASQPVSVRRSARGWRMMPKVAAALLALGAAALGGSLLASPAEKRPHGQASVPASQPAIESHVRPEASVSEVPKLQLAAPVARDVRAPSPKKVVAAPKNGGLGKAPTSTAVSSPEPAHDPKQELLDPYR